MKITPLVLKLLIILAFLLPFVMAYGAPAIRQSGSPPDQKVPSYVPRPHMVGQRGANEKRQLPGDGNLPEAASALPLFSAIAAGALLGGLLSARRTRRDD